MRVREKLSNGWRVNCEQCGTVFDIPYRLNATRASKPKFCSEECEAAGKKTSADAHRDERFWRLVDRRSDDECWPWKGHCLQSGYGWFNFDGQPTNASRAAYRLGKGDIPEGMFVCHSCDNPPCCNPAHLWLGTPDDNTQDKIRKGRARKGTPRRGADSPAAKLTPEQALEAWRSLATDRELAERWGVTPTAIYRLRHGLSWAHLTGAKRQ